MILIVFPFELVVGVISVVPPLAGGDFSCALLGLGGGDSIDVTLFACCGDAPPQVIYPQLILRMFAASPSEA